MLDPAQLGRRIKFLRGQKKLSQNKLAEYARLNGKYLGEVERGKANISILNLAKVAEVLDVPLLSVMDCEHEQAQIKKQLYQLIEKAEERDLIVISRIIEAVLR